MIIHATSNGTLLQFGTANVKLIPNGFEIGEYKIESPGEYDIEGVGFEVGEGYGLIHGNGLRILAIEPSHPRLSAETVTALEDIQLVVVPAESDQTKVKTVAGLLNDLEPRGIVVLGDAAACKALTGQSVEPVSKLKLQETDLSGEDLRVWTVN